MVLDSASGERYKTVAVSLQAGPAMEKEPDADWVLPLYLYSERDSVNAEKSELLISASRATGFSGSGLNPGGFPPRI